MTKHPFLYEINAFTFLSRMMDAYGKRLTLNTVPLPEWKRIRDLGFDCVWLMGVWKRSPAAREQAETSPGLRVEYERCLGEWSPNDVTGSPYAVYQYRLDPYLGKLADLALLRKKLNKIGLRLILDFVPNHLAMDHDWVNRYPDRFIEASHEDIHDYPGYFFRTEKGRFLAHGRDPNFPSWSDTVQVNVFSSPMRRAMIQELVKIASVCDGVRCDMAMLVLNQVFERTWGMWLNLKFQPKEEFWTEALKRVRERFPKFMFIAEVYWDMEWRLQQLGFDYTYDKRLYDRLVNNGPEEIRGHLRAETSYQERSVRFIENHDEERSLAVFGRERAMASAAVIATLPGMRFFYDGQLEGAGLHYPVQLRRGPKETPDAPLERFYGRLLRFASQAPLKSGQHAYLNVNPAADGNYSHNRVLSWLWHKEGSFCWVIVNLSPEPAQARVPLPHDLIDAQARPVSLYDRITDQVFVRSGQELVTPGLYAVLDPWQMHLLDFKVR